MTQDETNKIALEAIERYFDGLYTVDDLFVIFADIVTKLKAGEDAN